jgi:site-specific DNA recombinase
MLAKELRREGFRSKQGTLIDKGYLYRLLNNRVYRGEALHKGKSYPGEHAAIIDANLWDRAHSILQESPRKRANNSRPQAPALLKGLIFSDTGAAMTPTSTKKGVKLYRYYVSMDVIRNRETGEETAPMRLAAGMVEHAVVTEVRRILQTPDVVTQVLVALKLKQGVTSEADAIAALHDFDALWGQSYPAEQARITQLLVRRIIVTAAGLEVDIRREGIAGVIREVVAPRRMEAADDSMQ